MRDTSDMMEDALSEDTMMDCVGDSGALGDLVDLATDVADSSPTIRDAAERLLTLLGVDEDNEDLLSSEDEGVEVDLDELDDDEEEQENTRLLHQLAASLAQELKYSQQKQNPSSTRLPQGRHSYDSRDHQVQNMETTEDTYLGRNCHQREMDVKETLGHFIAEDFINQNEPKFTFGGFAQNDLTRSFTKGISNLSTDFPCLERRLRMDSTAETEVDKSSSEEEQVPASWGAGWDACASEALRYLVEDEGLPAHHPTVLAMKNHLDLQRERAFAQYTA